MRRLTQGVRPIGIATAGVPFGGGGNMAFADCMLCDQSIMLRCGSTAEVDAISDAEARRIFEAAGWTIGPTRCPAHVGQALPAE